jgi:regulator of sirC expression with transglutaminase-like and TPR domain
MQTATLTQAPDSLPCCDAQAFKYFCRQLPLLETNEGLLRAAIGLSMHALDDADAAHVERQLEVLSIRVRERSPSRRPAAILANMHSVLFDEACYRGDTLRYYNAMNCYLPAVLKSRQGLPSLLSLLYKLVGEGAGLRIEGINAPGHFLVRVHCDNGWMIVDPFYGGQVLSREEAFERLDRVTGQQLPREDRLLATATHAQWIARILGNLRQLFAAEGRRDDLAAMIELADALDLFQQQMAIRQTFSNGDTVVMTPETSKVIRRTIAN